MAVTWGSYVNSSNNGMRLGYEFSQSPSTVTSSTSSVTVTLDIWFDSKYAVSDSDNNFAVSGNFSSTADANISTGGSPIKIRTLTRTVVPQFSGTVKSSFSASLSGINAIPGTATVSGSWTTAKKPYDSPSAPTGVSVSRVSDTKQTLSWTRNATTGAPYTNQKVYRWDSYLNYYKLVATISGTATSWSDTSTIANRRYRYYVAAVNSAGQADSSPSSYISTTPYFPYSVAAEKTGSGSIVVTWTKDHIHAASGFQIQRRENSGTWGNTVSVGDVDTWTHTSPNNSVTHQYRVRAVAGYDSPTLYSDWIESDVVQLLAPPNAPTQLSPSGGAHDADNELTLSWKHNPVDTTAQTKYDLRYRTDGGSWTTVSATTSTRSRTISAGTFTNGTTVEWQVRTYGSYATAPAYSPWSTSAFLTMSAAPSAGITTPTSSVTQARTMVEWTYFDPESTAQAGWQVRLYSAGGGTILEEQSGSGDQTSVMLTTLLGDGDTYEVGVMVQDGDGLWSLEEVQPFTVTYLLPPTPILTTEWDPATAAMWIGIENPTPGAGEETPSHNELWRSLDGSLFELIDDNLPLNATVTDYIPAIGAENTYVVVTMTELGAKSMSEPLTVTPPNEGTWFWINGGQSFATQARIRYNPSRGRSFSRGKTLNVYAGREYPVETAGEQRTRDIDLSALLLGVDDSTIEQLEEVADLPAPLCLRLPTGSRIYVSLESTTSTSSGTGESVNLKMTQVAPPEVTTMRL